MRYLIVDDYGTHEGEPQVVEADELQAIDWPDYFEVNQCLSVQVFACAAVD